jgi:hypothetical protein
MTLRLPPPVAYLFTGRDTLAGRNRSVQFAAIDYVPPVGDSIEILKKEPLCDEREVLEAVAQWIEHHEPMSAWKLADELRAEAARRS